MIRSRSIFEIDIYLTVATIALTVVGILFIYSSGITSTGQLVSNEYLRQIAWGLSGLLLMSAVTFFDYRRLEGLAVALYLGLIVMLTVTLAFGRVVNGARSWLGIGGFGIQVSEFGKPILALVLARLYIRRAERIKRIGTFLLGGMVALLPTLLILLQPDLGTALVYIPIFLAVSFAAGTPARYVAFVLLTGSLMVVFAVLPVWQTYIHHQTVPYLAVFTELAVMQYLIVGLGVIAFLASLGLAFTRKPVFYWLLFLVAALVGALLSAYLFRNVLREYQIMRLIVFLDPYVDPRGAGWNIIQSVTAVGSGGPFGKGFLQGTQSHYRYLPQQSTDFIFSILAEEWGFLGVMLVFSLFLIIIGRGLYIMLGTKDRLAAYMTAGIVAMFFFHFAVNVGMAVGIMPITGIPLFLLSYGGSALWTAMVSVGVMMSIYQHR